MTERPVRERVTAPRPAAGRTGPSRSGPPGPPGPSSRLDDSRPVEEIYVGSLLRAQLRLALRTLGLVAVLAVAVPLVFTLRPDLAQTQVLGIPLAWALLAVGAYPLLALVGWRYLRGAERNERDFVELVRRGPR